MPPTLSLLLGAYAVSGDLCDSKTGRSCYLLFPACKWSQAGALQGLLHLSDLSGFPDFGLNLLQCEDYEGEAWDKAHVEKLMFADNLKWVPVSLIDLMNSPQDVRELYTSTGKQQTPYTTTISR